MQGCILVQDKELPAKSLFLSQHDHHDITEHISEVVEGCDSSRPQPLWLQSSEYESCKLPRRD